MRMYPIHMTAWTLAALLCAGLVACTTQPARSDEAIARLKSAQKVTVLSAIGDEIEWAHFGLTIFENSSASRVRTSDDLDKNIAKGLAATLSAKGIRASPSAASGQLHGIFYTSAEYMAADREAQRQSALKRVVAAAAADGAELAVVVVRPCPIGRCVGPQGANGITVKSRSALGLKTVVEVCVVPYVFVLDTRTGSEIAGRQEQLQIAGRLSTDYSISDLNQALVSNDAEIAAQVSRLFARPEATWIGR